jgi:hypothetical protein
MMIWLIAVLLLLLSFLILRFVQPELIYAFKQPLAEVAMNRLLLVPVSRKASEKFRALLISDLRQETRFVSGAHVRDRLVKNRELLRGLESVRLGDSSYPSGRSPTVCLHELANLLSVISFRIRPSGPYDESPVEAANFLHDIAVSNGADRDGLSGISDLEIWFQSHPITIEQAIELIYAAMYALSYRIE